MERHIPIDVTYCPFPRVVSLQNLSVVLFGDDSEESEILYQLAEESDDLVLLGATSSFMR